MVRGQPFFLSEEFVRQATGGGFGLEWLAAFVLLPTSEQARVELLNSWYASRLQPLEQRGKIVRYSLFPDLN